MEDYMFDSFINDEFDGNEIVAQHGNEAVKQILKRFIEVHGLTITKEMLQKETDLTIGQVALMKYVEKCVDTHAESITYSTKMSIDKVLYDCSLEIRCKEVAKIN